MAPTLRILAAALLQLGQAEKAVPLFERALGIQEREYGREHREVAPTLGNLAAALRELGQAENSPR